MRMGRPREFDAETALEQAMEVFWQHGYEGATMAIDRGHGHQSAKPLRLLRQQGRPVPRRARPLHQAAQHLDE